jgi:hypothetical protein
MADISFPFSPSPRGAKENAVEAGYESKEGKAGIGAVSAASMAPYLPPLAARLLVPKENSPGSGPPHAQPRLTARRQANGRAERVGGSGDLPTTLSSTFTMEVRVSTVVELLCSSSTHGGWGGGPVPRRVWRSSELCSIWFFSKISGF